MSEATTSPSGLRPPDGATASLERRLDAAERTLAEKDAAILRLRDELDGIHRMKWWKLASLYWGLLRRLRRSRPAVEESEGAERAPLAALSAETISPVASPPVSSPVPEDLSPEVLKIAERFARFREPGRDRFFLALAQHLSPVADPALVDMYFGFAITANERGRSVAKLLERYGPLAGKKALDIGCAYAGFVVAFSEAGAEATGIDLDLGLLRLGRLNLEDHQVTADLHHRDAMSPEVAEALRDQFDIVTCNDVIEHVEDPPALVRFIATALRPGGLGYLEIPNRNVPTFVLKDGHYQLFGIVLLERPEAERYHALHAPGVPYSVGHYLELDRYRDLFLSVGLEMLVLPETLVGVTLVSTLEGVRVLREALPERLLGVPEEVRPMVEARVSEYVEAIENAPRTTTQERERFLITYGAEFWKVLVRRAA